VKLTQNKKHTNPIEESERFGNIEKRVGKFFIVAPKFRIANNGPKKLASGLVRLSFGQIVHLLCGEVTDF